MSLLDLIKQKKEAIAATRRGRTIKPPAGRSTWRVFPSWRGEGEQFWHDFGQHFIKDASENLLAIYIDTEKTFGVPSELNALIAEAIKSTTDDVTMDLLKEAKSTASVLLNAIQIDGAKPTELQILELRPSTFEMFLNVMMEYEEAGMPMLDVNGGREIIINREGTGLQTKYTVNAAAINRGTVPADWKNKLNNLDEYVKQENAEGAFRALNAVKQIAGLLPAPVTGGAGKLKGIPTARPALGAAPIADPYAVAAPLVSRGAVPTKPVDEVIEDVPDLSALTVVAAPAAAPAAPKPTSAPAAAVTAEVSVGDADLDAMLASLGD